MNYYWCIICATSNSLFSLLFAQCVILRCSWYNCLRMELFCNTNFHYRYTLWWIFFVFVHLNVFIHWSLLCKLHVYEQMALFLSFQCLFCRLSLCRSIHTHLPYPIHSLYNLSNTSPMWMDVKTQNMETEKWIKTINLPTNTLLFC